MKGFVRIIALIAAVFAVSGTCGTVPLTGTSDMTVFHEARLFPKGETDEFCRHDFPALNDGGFVFSAARSVSEASRVRNLQEERNNNSQHTRSGFFRSGKVICTARPCNFIIDSVTVPIPGFLSGLSSAVALKRLRI